MKSKDKLFMKKKKGNKIKDKITKDKITKDNKIKEPINLTINVSMKQVIPKAMREQVWIKHIGRKFESRCYIQWCKNTICINICIILIIIII